MPFEVIPAVDVSEGRVVRLVEGDPSRKTVYGDDPAGQARAWRDLGAPRVHLVDLDGAFAGSPRNREAILAAAAAAGVPVQVGGGIRTLEIVDMLLTGGVDRVVLGTKAVTDEAFLREALRRGASRVVVALDVRGREVQLEGWTQGSGQDVASTARRLAQLGVARVLCTDVARDGKLEGPNLALYEEIAGAAGIPVIASGGVASLDDLRALAALATRGVEGVIVGKALYDGRVDLRAALDTVGAG